MGGIGTGCFAINSRGQLQDFELFNLSLIHILVLRLHGRLL